jgi:FtsP/CotA-like multicopper oxidase with cupredoxin domain
MQESMRPSRREALATLGASALAGAAAPLRAFAGDHPVGGTRAFRAFAPDVELALTAEPAEVSILQGNATRVWRFSGRLIAGPPDTLQPIGGSYLGPTLRLKRGQNVRIRLLNRLPDPTIAHWHGLDVPESADGHPRLAIGPGGEYVYEFTVVSRAGTYWYHPHPHMQTGPQVYRGLAGLVVVSDDEEQSLGLPDGSGELTWVLQDRRFDADNQLVYSLSMMDMETGWIGDRVLVNGRERPALALATRAYRVRVLNGSNARVYKLAWSDGTPMTVIGTDGGLLARPVVRDYVTLAPAQRVELWLDLAPRPVGTRLELRSAAFAPADAGLTMGGRGMGRGRGFGRGAGGAAAGGLPLGAEVPLLTVDVARAEKSGARLPARLSAAPARRPLSSPPVRRVPLTFQMMQWQIDGRTFDLADVAAEETVAAGSTHVWELVNAGGPMGMQMAHPIHLHGRQFEIVSRTGGSPTSSVRAGLVDEGLHDTVLVLPNETVRIRVTFSEYRGLFLYHCHILEHEDMGMMRNFLIKS